MQRAILDPRGFSWRDRCEGRRSTYRKGKGSSPQPLRQDRDELSLFRFDVGAALEGGEDAAGGTGRLEEGAHRRGEGEGSEGRGQRSQVRAAARTASMMPW